jgi:hypothetical protein
MPRIVSFPVSLAIRCCIATFSGSLGVIFIFSPKMSPSDLVRAGVPLGAAARASQSKHNTSRARAPISSPQGACDRQHAHL